MTATWHVQHEELFFVDVDSRGQRIGSSSSSSSSAALCPLSPSVAPHTEASPLREIEMNGVAKHARKLETKPPTAVAKRNARERRRVQAVNSAFVRLRKAVPFENNRGKRVSKVKTLQYAIDYIQNLQNLLSDYNDSHNMQYYYNYYQSPNDQHVSTSEYSSYNEFSDSFDFPY